MTEHKYTGDICEFTKHPVADIDTRRVPPRKPASVHLSATDARTQTPGDIRGAQMTDEHRENDSQNMTSRVQVHLTSAFLCAWSRAEAKSLLRSSSFTHLHSLMTIEMDRCVISRRRKMRFVLMHGDNVYLSWRPVQIASVSRSRLLIRSGADLITDSGRQSNSSVTTCRLTSPTSLRR